MEIRITDYPHGLEILRLIQELSQIPDPVIVPRNPHVITRSDLNEANKTAERLLDLIRRQFVLGGAYYESV